jgi:pyrimidine oxygenase
MTFLSNGLSSRPSKTSPQYKPSFELNKDVSQLAERIGFDYVFSMAKWGGLDGETEYWNYTLESLTLTGALNAPHRGPGGNG